MGYHNKYDIAIVIVSQCVSTSVVVLGGGRRFGGSTDTALLLRGFRLPTARYAMTEYGVLVAKVTAVRRAR